MTRKDGNKGGNYQVHIQLLEQIYIEMEMECCKIIVAGSESENPTAEPNVAYPIKFMHCWPFMVNWNWRRIEMERRSVHRKLHQHYVRNSGKIIGENYIQRRNNVITDWELGSRKPRSVWTRGNRIDSLWEERKYGGKQQEKSKGSKMVGVWIDTDWTSEKHVRSNISERKQSTRYVYAKWKNTKLNMCYNNAHSQKTIE